MKRIEKVDQSLLLPYIPRFIHKIKNIDQASTQWTLAQLFLTLEKELSEEQFAFAKAHLKKSLETHTYWIVLNTTMETLARWSKKDTSLKEWLKPHLERLSQDSRKSVARRAKSLLHS